MRWMLYQSLFPYRLTQMQRFWLRKGLHGTSHVIYSSVRQSLKRQKRELHVKEKWNKPNKMTRKSKLRKHEGCPHGTIKKTVYYVERVANFTKSLHTPLTRSSAKWSQNFRTVRFYLKFLGLSLWQLTQNTISNAWQICEIATDVTHQVNDKSHVKKMKRKLRSLRPSLSCLNI